MNQLVQLQTDVAKQEYTQAHGAYERVVFVNTISVALILGMASLICWALVRSITKPLEKAVKIAETVAAGDLTSHIEVAGRDETSQLLAALKRMNDNLQRIVGDVRMGSEAIGSATKQIAAGNLDLSSRTEEQAASLEGLRPRYTLMRCSA